MAIHKKPKKRRKPKSRKVIGAGTVINRGRGTGPRKKPSSKKVKDVKKKTSTARPKFSVQINKF